MIMFSHRCIFFFISSHDKTAKFDWLKGIYPFVPVKLKESWNFSNFTFVLFFLMEKFANNDALNWYILFKLEEFPFHGKFSKMEKSRNCVKTKRSRYQTFLKQTWHSHKKLLTRKLSVYNIEEKIYSKCRN